MCLGCTWFLCSATPRQVKPCPSRVGGALDLHLYGIPHHSRHVVPPLWASAMTPCMVYIPVSPQLLIVINLLRSVDLPIMVPQTVL